VGSDDTDRTDNGWLLHRWTMNEKDGVSMFDVLLVSVIVSLVLLVLMETWK